MYNLSVLAMFKNESMIIKDWIEHYLREGVEHFYLIDNGSTDDYYDKIKIYNKYITLVKDPTRLDKGTQTHLYTKIFLDVVKRETKWLIICDIDEYIYSRNNYNKITDVLNKLPSNVEKIWLSWKIFGSNGHINQPKNIIKSFNKRSNNYNKDLGFGKTICKTINLNSFGCCGHYVVLNKNNEFYNSNGILLDNYELTEENNKNLNLHLNHYMVMSEEYYLKIKCTRGGGESGSTSKYTIDYFKNNDKKYNVIIDDELFNKKYIKEIHLLFSSNDKNMFYKYLDKATYYFEYGSGATTYQASIKNNLKKIISVESDIEWFNKLKNMIKNNDKIIFKYCDMKTKPNDWGNPGVDSILNNCNNYTDVIKTIDKDLSSKLDLILIDGRFRVACCLKCYNIINNNCFILFNDFLNRKHYHVVLDYFEIVDKTEDNKMVVLKKIIGKNIPEELIKKYEMIKKINIRC
jgi:hypothetical protein